jgi:AsmA family protein
MMAAAVPLAAIGFVIWGTTRDLSRYEARLADQVRKVTGRELTARVPLGVRLGSPPALVAEGVTLSNAAWGTRPELARVRKITLFLDPISMLLGDVKVGRILLEGADILVERNDIGDTNLEMLPPPDGSGPRPGENRSFRLHANPAFPWIGVIEVRDSVLTIREGAGRPATVLEIASATMKSSAPNQPLQLEARFAAPQSAAIQLTGTAGSFDGWMRGLPGNIDVQGTLADGRIAIKGGIGVKGTNLQMTAEGPDVGVFGNYIRLPLPSGGPYVLNAKASTQRNGFKVEVPSLKVGSSEVQGEALFRVNKSETPIATVNIDAAKIDLGDFHAAPAAPPQAAAPVQPASPVQRRFIPSTPLSANWLGRSTLSVNARVGEVVGLSGKIQNGSVTLTSSEKRFAFRAAATVGGGSAGFDLVFDPAGRVGQTTLTASVSHVSFEDLSAILGLKLGLRDAVGDIDLRLRGNGRNTREVLNTASGVIDVTMGKGIWPADSLIGWPPDTLHLLGESDRGLPFNCVAGRFEVSGGVANLRRLIIDTPRMVAVGGGYLHLRTENWEFILAPEARDNRNAALASPLRLKGGTGRATEGALDPGLGRLIIPGGVVPSLVAQVTMAGRQPGANACAVVAPRIDGLRPGLRAQLPAPEVRRGPVRRPAASTKPQRQ